YLYSSRHLFVRGWVLGSRGNRVPPPEPRNRFPGVPREPREPREPTSGGHCVKGRGPEVVPPGIEPGGVAGAHGENATLPRNHASDRQDVRLALVDVGGQF